MGIWTKEQLRAFIKENKLVTAQDAQNALKELFAETIQEMLEAELDTHLGYEKHEMNLIIMLHFRNLILVLKRSEKQQILLYLIRKFLYIDILIVMRL